MDFFVRDSWNQSLKGKMVILLSKLYKETAKRRSREIDKMGFCRDVYLRISNEDPYVEKVCLWKCKVL